MYSPFHKPNTFTVCTSNLPNGFSLPLLSLFLPNTSYRIMHATSYDVYRPYRMTSTLLQENEKCLPKRCPHLPFSQLCHHGSSVLWRLNCTTAPSPSWLLCDDLLVADLFLLLPSRWVLWRAEWLNSSLFPVILSYSFVIAPSSPSPTLMTLDIFVSSVQLNYHASNSCATGSKEIATTGPKIGI